MANERVTRLQPWIPASEDDPPWEVLSSSVRGRIPRPVPLVVLTLNSAMATHSTRFMEPDSQPTLSVQPDSEWPLPPGRAAAWPGQAGLNLSVAGGIITHNLMH